MNLTETNKPFYGVVDGIYYNQQDIRNEMNDSIFSRGVPQTPSLKPYFEKRSVATKYEYFPAMFGKTKQQSDIHEAMHENPTSMYPPPSGGVYHTAPHAINTESMLRNQYFAYQRGADQSVYIPSSKSDLYVVNVNGKKQPEIKTIRKNWTT